MTDQISLERADRIVTLFIPRDDARHSLLLTEVARALREVATECEWQQTVVAQMSDTIKEKDQEIKKLKRFCG